MKKRRQTLLFLAILCLLTLAASTILLLRAPFLQIKTISVEGSTLVPKEAIEAAALSSLSGNYFSVIPFSSALFFSEKAIEKSLGENFKQIDSFAVHRRGLSGLQVSVNERVPMAVVCSGFREELGDENCFWSDEDGYIFGAVLSTSTVTDIPAEAFNHYYVPTDHGSTTPGNNFVTKERFKELQAFVKGSVEGGLAPLGILVGENGEYEMYVENEGGDSEAAIYFDDRAPFEKTLENLLTFWQESVTSKKSGTAPAFDYINLRFGNTVYYSTQ